MPLADLLGGDELCVHTSHHGVFLFYQLFHLDEIHLILLQCLVVLRGKAGELICLLMPIKETVEDRKLEFIERSDMLTQERVNTRSAFFFECCPNSCKLLRDLVKFLAQLTQICSIHLRNCFYVIIKSAFALSCVFILEIPVLSLRIELLL